MATEMIPFTQEGFDRLTGELKNLKSVERPSVIADIAEARAHGDLSENAEYHAAKEKQGFIEARIARLEDELSRAEVIVYNTTPDQVRFGALVTLENEENGQTKKYRIVGELEADVEAGKISTSSPIARALMGKRLDDIAEVKAPKGTIEYLVTEISY
jgi:transcription elongation factor GreA